MLHRFILKLAPLLLIFSIAILWLSYSKAHNQDTFSAYRDFVKKPLRIIKPPRVKHYQHEEALIREKLKLDLSQKERAILAGLHWILGLVDNDDAFAALFPDFMLFIDKMSQCEDRIHQKQIVDLIIKTSFTRASDKLDEFFNNNNNNLIQWRFLGLFPILLKHPEFQERYFGFYATHWPDPQAPFIVKNYTFEEALTHKNYQALFDYLVWPSFLHYYRAESKNNKLLIPEDKFPEYLDKFRKFNYADHDISSSDFRDAGYLATHVILALTNYGLISARPSENLKKAHDYIIASFEKTRELGDFDLYAEYIQCLKIVGSHAKNLETLEQFLYDMQRSDGSWGSEKDFTTAPYTAIHPSGAALMALNQG